MIMLPKKTSATMIVSKMMGHGDGKDPFDMSDAVHRGEGMDDNEDDMMLESIMEDFIKALDKKDAKGAAEALKQFFLICDDDDDESESEEPEQDEMDHK